MTADNSPSRSLVIADAEALPATLAPEIESDDFMQLVCHWPGSFSQNQSASPR